MTDGLPSPTDIDGTPLPTAVELSRQFPPMHVVTRLGRVIQQLRSFGELHAGELEALATELDLSGHAALAARLRMFREVQRDEAQMVVDELVDIQTDVGSASQAELLAAEQQVAADGSNDPAIDSPKRARWLAEQAAEEERRRQPLSRRDFFGGGAAKPEEPSA